MANEEIEISELEFTEELASDNLIPVEGATDTRATSLQVLMEWLKRYLVGKTGDETIAGVKAFLSNPILNASTANTVAIIDGNRKLTSSETISTTELGYLNGVTSNVQTQLNGKANTSLSNVSNVASSFKEQSVGWGMPDYSAGVSITLPYKAKFKGVVHLVTANNTGRLKINNIEVGGSYSGGGYEASFAALLDVGDVLSSSAAPIKATFFPLKGVN